MKGAFILQTMREDLLINPQSLLFYYQTNGWWGGSNGGHNSMVCRITYANDTATASLRGLLTTDRGYPGSIYDHVHGWYAGGVARSSIDRITFLDDTIIAVYRANLNGNINSMYSVTDFTIYGWFAGGASYMSGVSRLTYANDTVMSNNRGRLNTNKSYGFSANNTVAGWFIMGSVDGSNSVSTVEKLLYSTDNITCTYRGNSPLSIYQSTAAGNETDGWCSGGLDTAGYVRKTNTVRINYATDTSVALLKGNRINQLDSPGSIGNLTDGWWAGGNDLVVGMTSRVERLNYATDTVNLVLRGPLAVGMYGIGTT